PDPVVLPRVEPLRLSFSQQRLWFLQRLSPEDPSYNLPFAVRLRGEVEPAHLQRALDSLLRQHEVLRSLVVELDGQPYLHVLPAPLAVVDLSTLDGPERQVQLRQQIEQAARTPFDLGRDLPLRATLLVLGPAEHLLALTLHHVASDAWSMRILARDLGECYRQ